MSEDRQLQAAHLILGYKPLSCIYQDAGQALKAGNPRLARIDVSKPGFLARRDLPPVVLPAQLNLPQFVVPLQQVPLVAVPVAEGVASSSHLLLEEEIENFQFVEERTPKRLVEIWTLRLSLTGFLQLISQGKPLLSLKQAPRK